MTTIERKVYDADGSEAVLCVPCVSVSTDWDGEVNASSLHIDDAFGIGSIDISDDHSTGIYHMLADIISIQGQDRKQGVSIAVPVVSGKTDAGGGSHESVLSAVDAKGVKVDGIRVSALYSSDDVRLSCVQSSASFGMPVYTVIPADKAAALNALFADALPVTDGVEVDALSGVAGYDVAERSRCFVAIMCSENLAESMVVVACVVEGKRIAVPVWGEPLADMGISKANIYNAVALDAAVADIMGGKALYNVTDFQVDSALKFSNDYLYEISCQIAKADTGLLQSGTRWDHPNEFTLRIVNATTMRLRGRVVGSRDFTVSAGLHVYRLEKSQFFIDGVVKANGTVSSNTTHNVYIGSDPALKKAGFTGLLGVFKVFDADGNVLQYMCPVKTAANEIGMYDFVSGQFIKSLLTTSKAELINI